MIALAAALAAISVALWLYGLDTAVSVAGLVVGVVGFPSLAWGLWVWSREWTQVDLEAVREQLASLVQRQWEDEEAHRGLGHPHPMPVRWRLTAHEEVTAHPDLIGAPPAGSSEQIAILTEQFRASPRRRLVILGGPGAGKTTLAVQLVRALLNPRQVGEPVPVLLTLAEWWSPEDTGLDKLREWLKIRLVENYPALRTLGEEALDELVKPRGILPVLDGLDELPDAARVRVFSALRRAVERDEQQLILTCRTEYYLEMTPRQGPLGAAAVVEPLPLTPADAAGYLRHAWPSPGPQRQPILDVLEAVDPPEALAEVVSTPLGLWLLRVAHSERQADSAVLLHAARLSSADALRGHLFDQLIPALIKAREPAEGRRHPFEPRRQYAAADVRRWMESFAFYLTRMPVPPFAPSAMADRSGHPGRPQVTRDFLWLHLAHATLPPHVLPRVFALAFVPLGAAMGTVAGITANRGFNLGLMSVPVFGLVGGVLVGLWGYWRGRLVNRDWTFHQRPFTADPRRTGQLVRLGLWLLGGFTAGTMSGIALYAISTLVRPIWERVATWPSWASDPMTLDDLLFQAIPYLIGVFLVLALKEWAAGGWLLFDRWTVFRETTTELGRDQPNTPFVSWRVDRDAGLIQLTGTMVCGVASGSVLGWSEGGLDTAALGALFFGCLFLTWLQFEDGDRWLAHRVTTRYLAARGEFPKQLMPFLDDAYRIGLLRAVGPVYQFRHAEFQDYLLATLLARSPDLSPAGTPGFHPPYGTRPLGGTSGT